MTNTSKREKEALMEAMTSLLSDLQQQAPEGQDISLAAAMASTLFYYSLPENHPGKEFQTVFGAELSGRYRFGEQKNNHLNIILGKSLRTDKQSILPVSIAGDDISTGVRGLFRMDMDIMLMDLSLLPPAGVTEAIRMASQSALAGHIVLLVSDRGADLDDALALKARHLTSPAS